jgi:hypothetical protein
LWKNNLETMKKRIILIIGLASFLFSVYPLKAESISFKISYNTASKSKSDLNTWIESYNSLWNDWRSKWGGQLSGQLDPINYGPKYEMEIRIPIFFGISLNLAGSSFGSAKEGTIQFVNSTGDQTEKDFIRNEVNGLPIKIGFSYIHPLPFLENLYVFGGIGRHITFLKYTYLQDYELSISNITYILTKENSYNYEALGIYATLGFEYDLIKNIAVVAEAEKVWSKADGFKGEYTTELIDPVENTQTKDSGKASLYFYENKQWWNDKYYFAFAGHEISPEEPDDYPTGVVDIQNLRQGEFDLSTFSFKIGFRFKF